MEDGSWFCYELGHLFLRFFQVEDSIWTVARNLSWLSCQQTSSASAVRGRAVQGVEGGAWGQVWVAETIFWGAKTSDESTALAKRLQQHVTTCKKQMSQKEVGGSNMPTNERVMDSYELSSSWFLLAQFEIGCETLVSQKKNEACRDFGGIQRRSTKTLWLFNAKLGGPANPC